MKSLTIILMSMLVSMMASACATTQPITEPVSVIEAFYEALNDGDLDAAMSYVADDARFITDTLYIGKAQVRDILERGLRYNVHYELSDLRSDGDKVFFRFKETSDLGGFEASVEAVVQDGKIVSYTRS